jgi:hypothetical protein
MIGTDFPKLEWNFMGLQLLEPNAMIGDVILFTISLYFAKQVLKINAGHIFYQCWSRFYIWFGFSFLLGGFGHLLYNYLGLWGKYPSWILGMIATFHLTKAMISIWPMANQQRIFTNSALFLLGIGITTELLVFATVDLSIDQSKGLFVPTLVSGIGIIFALVVLGLTYQKKYHVRFQLFWLAALILLPNAFIQSQKINLDPWFDRNDFSHVLLLLSLVLYYFGIRKTSKATIFQS